MIADRSPRETWLPCVSAPAYEVSDLGGVRRRGSTVPLRPHRQASGYRTVVLAVDGKPICRGVHVLVAEAHLLGGPIPPGLVVRHRRPVLVSDDNGRDN